MSDLSLRTIPRTRNGEFTERLSLGPIDHVKIKPSRDGITIPVVAIPGNGTDVQGGSKGEIRVTGQKGPDPHERYGEDINRGTGRDAANHDTGLSGTGRDGVGGLEIHRVGVNRNRA